MNCIIIDDEPLAIKAISALCLQFPELHIVATCNNAMEAFQALHKYEISLIFLDINMPVIDGLSFLRSLKDPPAVILTTAYSEYALESYELNVIDYLLKPVAPERFAAAIQKFKARKGISGMQAPVPNITGSPASKPGSSPFNINTSVKDFMFIKENGKLVRLNFKDIFFIEGMKDYLKVVTTNKTYIIHQTMKSMEESLPANAFMRVHKSYIIALAAIKQIDGNCIETDKGGVPLSLTYRDALLDQMNI
ncbi:MAG: response regulator transcription factor [Taibaiella sp.]|nr:response regulator transcription factor [Taibaiella sp.]